MRCDIALIWSRYGFRPIRETVPFLRYAMIWTAQAFLGRLHHFGQNYSKD